MKTLLTSKKLKILGINRNIRRLEEKLDLSSFDSIFITTNIFIIGLIISSANVDKLSPFLLVMLLLLIIFAFFLIFLVMSFTGIFFNSFHTQFKDRIFIIKMYVSYILFFSIVILILTLLYFFQDFISFFQYVNWILIPFILLIATIIGYSGFSRGGVINKKIIEKFKNDFPILYDESLKNKERKILLKNKENKYNVDRIITVIGIILTLFGLFLSYYGIQKSIDISEQSLNDTFWLTSPVTLDINYTYDDKKGVMKINITNTHSRKGTGAISLYRLEVNPNTPYVVIEEGLSPYSSTNLSLLYEVSRKNLSTFNGPSFLLPSNVSFNETISFKIVCDNCPSNGYIRRLPPFKISVYMVTLNPNNGKTDVAIPKYRWLDYQ